MLRHEFCVLAGECVLSLGISRGENIVPDNLETVSARRQDNAFCYITVDSDTHMSQNEFGFNELALYEKTNVINRTTTKQILSLITLIFCHIGVVKQGQYIITHFVELLTRRFVMQPLKNQPLYSNTSNLGLSLGLKWRSWAKFCIPI
jgi:hypothetical protein